MGIPAVTSANIPFMYTLPMMVTNFGGDWQVSNVDTTGYNPFVYYNIPAQIAAQNSNYPIFNSPYGEVPPVSPDVIQHQVSTQLVPTYKKLASQYVNETLNTITQLRTRLNAKLDENITDEQKTQVKQMIEKLKSYEDKVAAISTELEKEDADYKAEFIKIRDLQLEVNQFSRDTIKKLNDMKAKADGSDNDDNDGDNDDADGSDGADGADGAGSSTKVDKFDSTTIAAVDQVYDAMYCWGTKDKELEAVLDLVDESNVMDLMLAWNKYHSAEKGESFMEAFMWDADSTQKVKYGRLIARALRAKAESIGVYDQCRADFAAIDKELGSVMYVSNDISRNYDNIIRIIAEKMGSKYGTPQKN